MRRRILITFGVVLMLVAASGCSGSTGKTITLTDADAGSTVQAAVGDQIEITLPANPSTGYAWKQQPGLDPAVVTFVSEAYQQAPTPSAMVGVGGTDTWTYKAAGAGTTTITLGYVPPGRSVPDQTFAVTVTVGG